MKSWDRDINRAAFYIAVADTHEANGLLYCGAGMNFQSLGDSTQNTSFI